MVAMHKMCPNCGGDHRLEFVKYGENAREAHADHADPNRPWVFAGPSKEWYNDVLHELTHARCSNCDGRWRPNGDAINYDPGEAAELCLELIRKGRLTIALMKKMAEKISAVRTPELP